MIREDRDHQDVTAIVVLVSELDISALGLPIVFRMDELEGHGGVLVGRGQGAR